MGCRPSTVAGGGRGCSGKGRHERAGRGPRRGRPRLHALAEVQPAAVTSAFEVGEGGPDRRRSPLTSGSCRPPPRSDPRAPAAEGPSGDAHQAADARPARATAYSRSVLPPLRSDVRAVREQQPAQDEDLVMLSGSVERLRRRVPSPTPATKLRPLATTPAAVVADYLSGVTNAGR